MGYKEVDDWIPADGLELEENALLAVKSDRNKLVIAGPGAGKTELLAQRACYLLETNTCKYPKKIIAISFKKDAARNLKERVEKRCGKDLARRFDSLTFDAFAKQILDRFHRGLPNDYYLNGGYEILLSEQFIIDEYESLKKGFTKQYSKNAVLNFHYQSLPETSINETRLLRKKVWQNLLRKKNSHLSFKMVMRLSELIIKKNPIIKQYLQKTYAYIFLDEFQDTTSLQYEYFNTCFDDSKAIITAVGDDKQRIMLWAGANPEIFDNYISEYSAKTLSLLMNFRSAPRLVELQNYLVKNLLNKSDKVIPSKKWKKEDGESYLWVYKDSNSEKQHLLEKVNDWISKDGLQPKDICILVKQQLSVYVGDLIEYFNKNGIKARDEAILQDLLAEEPIRYIINVLIYVCDNKAGESKYEALDFLTNINTKYEDYEILVLENEFYKFITSIRIKLKSNNTIDLIKTVVNLILEFADIDRIKSIYPEYKNTKHLKDLLLILFSEIENNLENVDSLKGALDTLIGKDTLPVMTIHKSKGLEYHTVIFVGLEDDAFWSYANQPDEDKCAFFVALSRAMKRVIFTFSNKRVNKWGNQKLQKVAIIKEVLVKLIESGIVESKEI